MSKYLIINADDFGYNQQQNDAILRLISDGMITSTSVISVAPCAENCSKLSSGAISVGVHLTINSDSDVHRWKSLTGSDSIGGKRGLPGKQTELTFGARHRDVYAELEAQYAFLTERGVVPDHADNHCGTLYGINGRRFYTDAFDFCATHSLPFRFPKDVGCLDRLTGKTMPGIVKAVQKAIVNRGERRGVLMLDDLVTDPRGISRIQTYDALRKFYLDAVDRCVDGITEIFMHPALPLDDGFGEWTKRVYEYELLKSGDLLERAKEKNVQVVTWKIFDEIKEGRK